MPSLRLSPQPALLFPKHRVSELRPGLPAPQDLSRSAKSVCPSTISFYFLSWTLPKANWLCKGAPKPLGRALQGVLTWGHPGFGNGQCQFGLSQDHYQNPPTLQHNYFLKTLAKRNFLREVRERFPFLFFAWPKPRKTQILFSPLLTVSQLQPELHSTDLPLLSFWHLLGCPKHSCCVSFFPKLSGYCIPDLLASCAFPPLGPGGAGVADPAVEAQPAAESLGSLHQPLFV